MPAESQDSQYTVLEMTQWLSLFQSSWVRLLMLGASQPPVNSSSRRPGCSLLTSVGATCTSCIETLQVNVKIEMNHAQGFSICGCSPFPDANLQLSRNLTRKTTYGKDIFQPIYGRDPPVPCFILTNYSFVHRATL